MPLNISNNSRFITVEGIDFSGKTFPLRTLEVLFKELKIPYFLTCEPGGGVKNMRKAIFEALELGVNDEDAAKLFQIDRKVHIRKIQSFLIKHPQGLVICDRFVDSTIVYQGIVGSLGADFVIKEHVKHCDVFFPGLTLNFYFPENIFAKTLRARRSKGQHATKRDSDIFDAQNVDKHLKRQKAFLSLKKIFQGKNIFRKFDMINGTHKPHRVAENVVVSVQNHLDSIGLTYDLVSTYKKMRKNKSELLTFLDNYE